MKSLRAGTWILVSVGATIIAAWVILASPGPLHGADLGLAVVVFGVHPFGALWMMYHSIRHERQPLGFVGLAFVPYTFLWYYFDRVRK